jgi:hypothetical protein
MAATVQSEAVNGLVEFPPIEPHAPTGWTAINLNALPLRNEELRILTHGTLHGHTS